MIFTNDKSEPLAKSPQVVASWTPARIDLHGWLGRNAPSLAELYAGAVTLLYDSPIPGRVRFIAHAVREIRNRLPDFISGQKGSGQFHWKNRLDKLGELWKRSPPAPGLGLNDSGPDPYGPEPVLLPAQVAREVARLLEDHAATREKPVEAAIRLFEASAPDNKAMRDSLGPLVNHWIDVTEWFMKRTHDSGAIDADCDEALLRNRFELFEHTLWSLIGRFFETVRELDEILEETNA